MEKIPPTNVVEDEWTKDMSRPVKWPAKGSKKPRNKCPRYCDLSTCYLIYMTYLYMYTLHLVHVEVPLSLVIT